MDIVILDGKELVNEKITHNILKEKLELPEYYGKNLNALWDCLTGWVDLPLRIVWTDFDYSKNRMGSFADELLQLFHEAKQEIEGFDIEIT